MISWPDEIVTAIARRRAVLFLGAGVSMNSLSATGERPPSWRQILEAGIAKCSGSHAEMKKMLKDNDLLGCCQIIKYKLAADWIPFIEDQFLNPKFLPSDIHEAILELDASIVMTPNFDKIYDDYATSKTDGLLKIKKFYDQDIPRVIRGSIEQRLILKIHGCIDTPDDLIFTKEDYANARHKHSNFYRAIEALFLTNTFIFMGCGMNDPDLNLMLEQYARSFSAAPPHYILLSGKISEDIKRMIHANYNLRVLTYSSASNHLELLDSVKNLRGLVADKRDQMAERRLW